MRPEKSPIDVLVTTEIARLRSQEMALAKTLCQLEQNGGDEGKWDHFLCSLFDVQHQASRLDRMLDAMKDCGFCGAEDSYVGSRETLAVV